MKASVVVILSLIVSACVVQSNSPTPVPASVVGAPAEPQAVVCKKEKPTGSNRPVRVCRAVAGVLDREQTERGMRVLQRQSEILSNPDQ
jgi:hypothetical protein